MRCQLSASLGAALLSALLLGSVSGMLSAENVDPDADDSQHAYAENVGWINAEPSGDGGPGMQVGDSELSGWLWGENIGWISLSCKNTLSCETTQYGVLNDGNGTLSGFAWAENAGWLSFSCENTSSCGASTYGVTVDAVTGDIRGRAWGENTGWVTFASAGTNPFGVKSGWVCPPPSVPTGTPTLAVGKHGNNTLLSWDIIAGATGSDIVRGDLASLRDSNGDFSLSTEICLDDNRTTGSLFDLDRLESGEDDWYLVRGQNCGHNGTYDSLHPSQVDLRDAGIDESETDCP